MKPWITVETTVKANIEKVWKYWNEPEHITHWDFASDDWCAPRAENDLRVGGKLKVRMEAKDGTAGFDLEAEYTAVEEHKRIEFAMGDRHVKVEFTDMGDSCKITESFEAEDVNSLDKQRAGWQAILDNFKKYTEAN